MKLPVLLLILFVVGLPLVLADDCGLSNLPSCIPEKFFEAVLGLFNAPIQPFLDLVKSLLAEPVDIGLFSSVWAVIVYVISLFYGLLLVFAGFNFIVSGFDAVRREKAKDMLRNVVLMVLFVQASYFLYGLALDLSSALTTGIFGMVDPSFFMISADSLPSLGLELALVIPYVLILLITVVLLTLRYLFVAVGVVFLPIGVFFSFVDPLNSYGKLILNSLLVLVFLPFFQSIVLLASSRLIQLDFFSNFKIVVMISSFLLVDLMLVVVALFTINNASSAVGNSDVGKAVAAGLKLIV